MRRWVRWQGAVAFLVLLAGGASLGWWICGPLVKAAVERGGSALVGARVEVGSARLTLRPLGVALRGLQVANPRRPMENSVEAERVVLGVSLGPLLRRRLVVEEMAVEGVEFNSRRAASGAMPGRPEPSVGETEDHGMVSLPPLRVPPLDEILARERFDSLERAAAVKAEAAEAEARIRERISQVPDSARAEELGRRLQELLGRARLDPRALADARSLRDEIRRDEEDVRALREEVSEGLATLRFHLDEARSEAGEDVRRLREKYAWTPAGLSNATRAVLGERAGSWVRRGSEGLRLLRLLPGGGREGARARGKGVDVPFPEREPLPSWWVRRASLSLRVPSGALSAEVRDLTSDPVLLGRPALFSAEGRDLPGGALFRLDGVADRTDPAAHRDAFRIRLTGWTVSDVEFGRRDAIPLVLRRASGNLAGEVVLRGESLEGSFDLDLSGVRLEGGVEGDAPPARALRSALDGVRSLGLQARVEGTSDDVVLSMTSDLDRILREAMGRAAREEADRLEAGLRRALAERMDPVLADLRADLSRVEGLGRGVEEVRARLEAALRQVADLRPSI